MIWDVASKINSSPTQKFLYITQFMIWLPKATL